MSSNNNPIASKVGATISGVTNTFTVTNPSDTASSAARETITVGGASAGDPSLNFNVSGTTDFEMGIDNNDSDKLKISQGTALGTNDTWIMTTSGERTMPLQPQFLAYLSADDPNATGDGTSVDIVYDTEDFNIGGNYNNATGVFTAPVTGTYIFSIGLNFGTIGAAHTGMNATLILTTGNDPRFWENSPAAIRASTDTAGISTVCFAQLAASETAFVRVVVGNGAKTVTIRGNPGGGRTNFFGAFLFA